MIAHDIDQPRVSSRKKINLVNGAGIENRGCGAAHFESVPDIGRRLIQRQWINMVAYGHPLP